MPPAPTNLVATPQSSSTVLLTWDGDLGAYSDFVIHNADTNAIIDSTGTNQYVVSGLLASTHCNFYVTLRDFDMVESDPSNTADATTLASKLALVLKGGG